MTPLGCRIRKAFFDGTPVRLDWNVTQQVLEDGTLVLGARAGPEREASNLVHEMSHLVEIDDSRIREPGWGLQTRTIYVGGRICLEPLTIQGIEREIRVMAYQANVMARLGMPDEPPVGAMVFMPDFINVPLEDGTPPFTEDGKQTDLDYQGIERSRIRWIAHQVETARNVYTYARFEAEWQRKVSLLTS